MDKRNNRLILYGVLTLLMMFAIFMMSAQNGTDSDSLSDWLLETKFGQWLVSHLPEVTGEGSRVDIRKYAHMTEYALLAVCVCNFFMTFFRVRPQLRTAVCGPIFCFLYACTDEIHQRFVPGRTGVFTDVLIDMIGVTAGVVLIYLIRFIGKEPR